ncbi:MAG: serine/threonine protein kinase, partial [Polyangiaceae bacterium]|nr:serine/threonine protein kinase [Polyangiaceae bacterium]
MGPGVHAELGSIWPEAGALRAGTRLGRYELLLPVGAGGMACVWAGRLSGEHGFSKLVAIKTVLPFLPNQRELRAMLYDEARVAAYAHHPNVCNVLDVGEDGGVTYLVLEWVEGDSLLRLLHSKQGGPIDCDVAARIVCDACAGLHAAHEIVDETGVLLGVVHRDVSPHNLLVSIDGTTKLADFGVAKALGQQHATTRAGELRGKIGYMAPEQIAGAAVDRRSDVFALGCVLYCATTGEAPFRGDNDGAVLRAVLDGQFEPPSQLMADYPSELAAIATRAMARAPEDRFDTAEAMRAALDAWILSRGPGVSRSPVAALVETRLGARLARRREQLRATLQACLEGGTRPVRPAPMLAEGGARAALPAAPMDPPRGAEGADAGAAGATPTSRSAHER